MIQLNLLPDVKLEYIKSQRTRRLTLSVAILVTAVCIGILLILLGYYGLQKKHLNDLNHDIISKSNELKNKPDINKILTVQNQLDSLTALHAAKPAVSNLFTYLDQITPAAISINNLTIDFNAHTASITGSADSLSTVNQYVDTLKHAGYTTSDDSTAKPAFSSVVLSSFGLNAGAKGNQAANYTVTFNYDPPIFDITKQVTLVIPNIVTTRSGVAQPSDLFQNAPATSPSGGTR